MKTKLLYLLTVLSICLAVAASSAFAQLPKEGPDFTETMPAWFQPVEPFRVIGNIHFVGTAGLGMYFIPGTDGHIVIDGGMPQHGQSIAEGIRTLGYDPADVKLLLNTHAHFDHSGGLASLKELTGAPLWASEGDRSALEGGFYLGYEDTPWLNAPPVEVDRVIEDGEVIELGDIRLQAHLTPGHTRGCTSWSMQAEEEGTSYKVLLFCSASVALNRLVGPPQYEGIVDDYRYTFENTRNWQPDVFLANHPEFMFLPEKRKKQIAGDPLAFVDGEEFPKFIQRAEQSFEKALEKQMASTTKKEN